MVGNGGLGNGINREIIEKIFSAHGHIADIVMQQKKSYCFLSFSTLEEAEKAYSAVHGRLLKCPEEVPVAGMKFYLAYTETSKV